MGSLEWAPPGPGHQAIGWWMHASLTSRSTVQLVSLPGNGLCCDVSDDPAPAASLALGSQRPTASRPLPPVRPHHDIDMNECRSCVWRCARHDHAKPRGRTSSTVPVAVGRRAWPLELAGAQAPPRRLLVLLGTSMPVSVPNTVPFRLMRTAGSCSPDVSGLLILADVDLLREENTSSCHHSVSACTVPRWYCNTEHGRAARPAGG
jgi:hypothetical protein